MKTKEIIAGIDLGTTNSEIAIYIDRKIEIVKEDDRAMVPSVVGLDPDGNLMVGEKARNQFVLYPENTITSVKRKMGSKERIFLGDKDYSPQEISAMILRELKQRAERFAGQPISKAVITVPAYFSDVQRQATREAGAIAGLEVVRILNEPTAACLAYESIRSDDAHTILAFDLGGGTFDVSIVAVQGDLVEVIASHGDNHLGGDDFDELIFNRILTDFYHGQTKSQSLTATGVNRLKRSAEMVKMRLSEDFYGKVIEDNLPLQDGKMDHLNIELSRRDFEDLSKPLLSKTVASIHHTLAAAGKKPKDIDAVILVGGSTRMPAICKLIEDELSLTPRQDIHPDLAVVYGAAVMASRIMGTKDQRILIDITPYTFGTSAFGDIDGQFAPYKFVPIIKSGTPLPVSRSEELYTIIPGQSRFNCNIFQGENSDARKNLMVGEFVVDNLSPDEPDGSPIVVHMNLDLDGILRVTATEKNTGLSKNVVIERSMDKLSPEAIKKSQESIAKLFGETDAGDINTVDVESEITEFDDHDPHLKSNPMSSRYTDLVKRVEKSKGNMDDIDRADSRKLCNNLRAARDANDKNEFDRLYTELEDLLFYVETGE